MKSAIQNRKASDVYKRQNTVIHKAMLRAQMPYETYKGDWLRLFAEIVGRPVDGLSSLTLGERHTVILHFQERGERIYAPAVAVRIRDWKKGDLDVEYEWREESDPQIRMVVAMWVEMGYAVKTLRGLCWKLFQRDDPRWLDERQLSHLVNVVQQKAQSKGCGNYYRRNQTG